MFTSDDTKDTQVYTDDVLAALRELSTRMYMCNTAEGLLTESGLLTLATVETACSYGCCKTPLPIKGSDPEQRFPRLAGHPNTLSRKALLDLARDARAEGYLSSEYRYRQIRRVLMAMPLAPVEVNAE